MKKCLMIMLSILTAAVFADEWVWVGGNTGASDSAEWSFKNNWTNRMTGVVGFPNSADDIAVFDGDAALRCAWNSVREGASNSQKFGGIKVLRGNVNIYSWYNASRILEFAGLTNVIEIAKDASLNLVNGPSIAGSEDGENVVVLTGAGTFTWSGNSRIGDTASGGYRLKDFIVRDFSGGIFEIPAACPADSVYLLHLASGMTAHWETGADNKFENNCVVQLDSGATFDMNGRSDVLGAFIGDGEIVNIGRVQLSLPSDKGPFPFGGRCAGTLEVHSGSAALGANSQIVLTDPSAFAETMFKPCAFAGGALLGYAAGIESVSVSKYIPADGQPLPLKDLAGNRVALTAGIADVYGTLKVAFDLSSAGGTITALATSTEAAPLVAGLDFADTTQMTVAIDTRAFATYINQTFGANTTVEKYGSSTLYALADSTHAKTSVEEGAVERLGPQQVFGLVWDAEGGESVDLTWKGTSGAAWTAAASWTPEQSPTRNDRLTVNGAASINLGSGRVHAKSLDLSGVGTDEFYGGAELFVGDTLAFSTGVGEDGYGQPKVVSVASGSSVSVRTAKQSVSNVGFVKAGAGDLALTYTQGGSVAFSDNLNPNTVQRGADTKPYNWYAPLTSIPNGNAAPTWQGLGPMNVLDGTLKITGVGSGFNGNNLLQTDSVTYLSTLGRLFAETPYGGWVIVGSAYPAEKAELILGNANATLGQLPNNNKPIIGAFTAGDGPARPALRLENNFCGIGDLLLGVGLKKTVWPEFTMTNATLRVYNFVRFGAWDYTKSYLNEGYYTDDPKLYNPVVRLGAGADLRHQLGGNAAAYVTLGGQCDVRVEDGAKVRMERHNTNQAHVGGYVRTDSWATGFMRFSRGALLTFVNGVFCNNYATETSASENFTFQFDGGILRPVRDDGSGDAPRFPYLFVAHPEHQGVVVMDGGMEANITTGFTYTFAAPMRGEGAVRKTGAGTIVIAKGRKPAADDTRLIFNPEDYANLPLSGVTTLQNAGGLVWEEGGLEIESGALNTCSRLKLCGQTLDFQNQTDIRCGVISGRGTVANASFAALVLAPVADGADTPLFDGVTFAGLPVVDFMASAEAPATLGRAVRVARVANAQGLPNSFLTKASNTGIAGIRSARCTVDSEGWVWAAPVQMGIFISIR